MSEKKEKIQGISRFLKKIWGSFIVPLISNNPFLGGEFDIQSLLSPILGELCPFALTLPVAFGAIMFLSNRCADAIVWVLTWTPNDQDHS